MASTSSPRQTAASPRTSTSTDPATPASAAPLSSPLAAANPSAASHSEQLSGADSGRYSKLDGVLYHFYAKTAALIATSRLTHCRDVVEPELIPVGQETVRPGSAQAAATDVNAQGPITPASGAAASASNRPGSSVPRRSSKWFAIETCDNEIFRDELRLWRSVSSFLPGELIEAIEATEASALLDNPPADEGPDFTPALVLDVILDPTDLGPEHTLILSKFADEERGAADGGGGARRFTRVAVSGKESARSSPHKPILLERWRLDFVPCATTASAELPLLYRRSVAHFREMFGLLRELPCESLYRRIQASHAAGMAVSSAPPWSHQLKLGVRLGAGPVWQRSDFSMLSFTDPLDPSTEGPDIDVMGKDLRSIGTSLGFLRTSVEYRKDVEFSIEDSEALAGLRELEMEEDYFRPTMAKHMGKVAEQISARSAGTTTPRSLLSTTADEGMQKPRSAKESQPPSSGPSAPGGQGSPVSDALSRSPGPAPAAFGTSASGRPVAGLSSLRRQSSLITTSSNPSVPPLSPVVAPAMLPVQSEAAFLTQPGRRPSMSDRRLRTLSQLSIEKGSPPSPNRPSPVATTSNQAVVNRPGNPRTASVLNAARFGSYSPSSPSPLAQQLSAQNVDESRYSTAQSFRGLAGAQSLRGVFTSYSPSASQASLASFSRTPPRSITGLFTAPTSNVEADPSVTTVKHASLTRAYSSPGASDQVAHTGSPPQQRGPTVSPRPISRYPSTFSYRQARQYGSEGAASGSYENAPGAPDDFSMYSRSWQARLEQRRAFVASREATQPRVRSSFGPRSLGESASRPDASPTSLQVVGSANTQEDLKDLVRMIELGSSDDARLDEASPSRQDPSSTAPRGPSSLVTCEATKPDIDSVGFVRSTDSDLRAKERDGNSELAPEGRGLSRWLVDELLTRMAASVNRPSPTSAGSGSANSQAAAGSLDEGGGSPSYPRPSAGAVWRVPRTLGRPSTGLPGGGGEATHGAIAVPQVPASSVNRAMEGLPFAHRQRLRAESGESPGVSSLGDRSGSGSGEASGSGGALRASRSATSSEIRHRRAGGMRGDTDEGEAELEADLAGGVGSGGGGASASGSHSLRLRRSASLHDLFAASYDDDEAAGRLELHPADVVPGVADDGVEGGMGALVGRITTAASSARQGSPRRTRAAQGLAMAAHPLPGTTRGATATTPASLAGPTDFEERQGQEDLARFRADLASHASRRGRPQSHSPWRNGGTTAASSAWRPTTTATAAATGPPGGGSAGGGAGADSGSDTTRPYPRERARSPF